MGVCTRAGGACSGPGPWNADGSIGGYTGRRRGEHANNRIGCPERAIQPREWMAVRLMFQERAGRPGPRFYDLPRWMRGAIDVARDEFGRIESGRLEAERKQR